MFTTLLHSDPALARSADVLRRQIAVRRDALVSRQRRNWSAARQRIIDAMEKQYRQVYQLVLDTEN